MRVLIGAALCAVAGLALARGDAAQAVSFGTDWKAEAEHGGYYQAVATGIYRRHGLDVTSWRAVHRSTTRNCSPPACSTSTWRCRRPAAHRSSRGWFF